MVGMSSRSLAGQVAVITGASRGIGLQVALHLSALGAAVAGIARPSEDLARLGGLAGTGAGQLMAVAADVTSPTSVHAALDAAQSSLGPPTLVVTCAGTAEIIGPAWSADPGEWWQAVAVDLLGTMITAQSAITRMLAAGSGRSSPSTATWVTGSRATSRPLPSRRPVSHGSPNRWPASSPERGCGSSRCIPDLYGRR